MRGGLGKTTISLGIIAAWRKRGFRIAPFKKGPDFIDAGWLGSAAGENCHNLDLFLMQEEAIIRSFRTHATGRDGAVIEGNRGLFDGMDEVGTYSTARLARMLDAPVALIVDCTKSSSTVAAVVLGCKQFDPELDLGAIILNNVASARQESVIRKAIEQHCNIPVMGAVPKLRRGEFPERHMGLTPHQEHPDVLGAIDAARTVAERYLDIDALWALARNDREKAPEPSAPGAQRAPTEIRAEQAIIGVIRDRAFQFYYPENLEALEEQGAELWFIDALSDRELPEIDALYIGGGFPETQAAALAENRSFTESLRNAVSTGLPVYAECGGLIYLGRTLRIKDETFPMAGVLPADFELEKRPQAHGYTIVEVDGPNPFFEKGSQIRGHEFHYSFVRNPADMPEMVFVMRRGKGIEGSRDGIVHKNVLATYTHLHAAGSPEWAVGMMKSARAFRQRRKQGSVS